MDLSAELKELRKQLYTYRYKSLELERQLRTHCHAFKFHHDEAHDPDKAGGKDAPPPVPVNAFEDTTKGFIEVFKNSLLMEMITSHLPVQDLLRCRLVCKHWAAEMAQYLTKRKALVVAYEDCSEARDLLRRKQTGKLINISTLCVLEISITSGIIVEIVKEFGETLSGLKLDDCNPDAKELHTLLQALPSLEVLSFKQTGVRRSDEQGDRDNPSRLDGLTFYHSTLQMHSLKKLVWEEMQPVKFFERIIKMFPRLEELELLCWSKPDSSSLKGLRLDTLKHLTLSCDNNFSEKIFKALASLNLKLRKLTLHDIHPGPGGAKRMKGLKLFLESISETVTEMNLNGCGRLLEDVSSKAFVGQPTPFPINFPVLRKLEIDCSLMTDLKMVNHIPKLQKLECKFQDWKGWWHLLNKNGVPESHQQLHDLSLGSIDSGCLMKITSCFKSITKLDVQEDRIDDVAFRVIATMSQLSHLRITTSSIEVRKKLTLTDSGFTGIPLEECHKLSEMPRNEVTPEYISNVRKHPFIGNLTALYSLELACSELSISDVAVLYGIAELLRVSTITLPNCKAGWKQAFEKVMPAVAAQKLSEIRIKSIISIEQAAEAIRDKYVQINKLRELFVKKDLCYVSSNTKLTNASLDSLSEVPGLLVLELHKSCGVSPEGVTDLRQRKRDLVFNLYSDLNSRIFA